MGKIWREIVAPAKAGLACAVIGMVFDVSSTTRSNIGGEVSCSYTDISGIGFGIAGVIAGVLAAREAGGSKNAPLNYGLAAVGVGLGVVNLLMGFGIIFSPCD